MPEPRQSPDFPNCFYRVTIKGLIVKDGKVLLVHDYVQPERPVWELPGGGLDFGEDMRAAIIREVKEEMGFEVTKVSEKPVYIWTAKMEKQRRMEWYYVVVVAYHIEVKSLDGFVPSDECRDMRFFSKEEMQEAPDLISQIQPLAQIFDPKDFS